MKALALLGLVAVGAFAGCAAPEPPPADVVVDVVASRYRFDPGTDQPIRVRVGDVVVFRVTSTDVTHGFAVEGLHSGVEVAAGQTVEVRVRADRAGEFRIYCTVFCGANHPEHRGTLSVSAA